MDNTKTKPELLIIANEEITYGMKNGYYPDFLQSIKSGNLSILTIEEASKENLSRQPIGNGMDFYVYNPYFDQYVCIWDSDILNKLVSDKSYAIKEALVRMGAKDIILKEGMTDSDNTHYNIQNKASLTLANADVMVDYDTNSSVNLKSCIESHDANRIPKEYNKVKEFMIKHGLMGETTLGLLLDRLKDDKQLCGTEKYEITYLNEIKSALNIAASINYQLFNDNLDFSRTHNHVHTISKTLEINFG